MNQKANAIVVRGEHANGDMTFEYTKDGKRCVHLQLHTKHAVKLAGLQLVTKELEMSSAAINLFFSMFDIDNPPPKEFDVTNPQQIILRSLYITAVITYAKVFSEVRTKGRSKLERDHVFKDEGAKYLPYHNWIVEEQRQKFIAHAHINEFEQTRTNLIMPEDISEAFDWHIVMGHATFISTPNPFDLVDFPRLIDFVLAHVDKLKQKQIDILLAEEAGPGLHARHKVAQRLTTIKPPKDAPVIPE